MGLHMSKWVVSAIATCVALAAVLSSPKRMQTFGAVALLGSAAVALMWYRPGTESRTFSICSFNVLAEKYANKKLFMYCPAECIDLEYRIKLLISILTEKNPDIICLQEMDFLAPLRDLFLGPRGLHWRFFKRSRNKVDGCLTVWNPKRFSLFGEPASVEFNALVSRPEMHVENLDLPFVKDKYTRDNVALLVVLEEIQTRQKLIVVNTHLYWNPHHPDVKLRQAAWLVKNVERLSEELLESTGKEPAVVICGDFNSSPSSEVYRFLSKALITESPLEKRNSTSRLIFEGNLLPVCRWLRTIGIDCAYVNMEKKSSWRAMFEIALEENRILSNLLSLEPSKFLSHNEPFSSSKETMSSILSDSYRSRSCQCLQVDRLSLWIHVQ